MPRIESGLVGVGQPLRQRSEKAEGREGATIQKQVRQMLPGGPSLRLLLLAADKS
jgi:hypothetical protein